MPTPEPTTEDQREQEEDQEEEEEDEDQEEEEEQDPPFDQLAEELNKRGVLFLENFWCCGSCGHAAADRERSGPEQFGYVFYHSQDTAAAAESGGLNLAFGSFSEDEESIVSVAQTFVETATNLGFDVWWNGSTSTRMFLSGLSKTYFESLVENDWDNDDDDD
eukprot:TRINITY_DN4303_c0_g1_i1.p1 TRINITY_DN4303_c0_g1~~TRINITY_DN4303_c0_g1_i1.p1  ORF type:complete len:163 (-),score=40.78 TRINITY_DN4303_c0_g1_i1:108-596(-)